jgi:formylglycine-generating enzyme required for sulfatase activity
MPALLRAIREQPSRLDGPGWDRFPGLAEVAARMLAGPREARYADGGEAYDALRVVERAPSGGAEPSRAGWRQKRWWGLAAGLLLVAGAAGVIVPGVVRQRIRRRALAAPPPAGMALIDVGTITVGRTPAEVDAQCATLGPSCDRAQLASQTPARRVEVPPFYLDIHEVTNQDMVAVLNAARAKLFVAPDEDDHSLRFVRFNAGIGHDGEMLIDLYPAVSGITYTPEKVYPEETYKVRAGRERWPVSQVSWFAANLYCRTMGKRLPTDVEWEGAARGASNRSFPWGEEPVRCRGVAVPSDGKVPMEPSCNSHPETPQNVGEAPQDVTPEGIHDLGGNVTEWVDALFGDNAAVPGSAAAEVSRVVRGGSYYRSLMARTSARMRQPSNNLAPNGGFRCATSLDEPNKWN